MNFENPKVKERVIYSDVSILHALKIMDKTGFRSLIVIGYKDEFIGILSIGDIQRAIIKNISLDTEIFRILRKNPRIANVQTDFDLIRSEMVKYRMELIPIIDEDQKIVQVHFWEDFFYDKKLPPRKQFLLPIVIMAGGIGSRLKPFTSVLPKALFPVGDHTIIEEIYSRFREYGCKEFYLSVNYKADLIKYYLNSLNDSFEINYIKEDIPLGTAGSLGIIKNKLKGTFFLNNCDILIDQDYSDILEYHNENENDITIVAALKHYAIPYGVLETNDNGDLTTLQEKPEITFKINSGMYVIESKILHNIPENTFYHMTQLISKVKENGGRIGVFPVSEKSWTDIGDWKEFIRNIPIK